MQYYKEPSQLGLPIIKLLLGVPNPSGGCRHTIYWMECEHNWGWNLSNALKYLWRLGVKSVDTQSDLIKAIHYLEWELEHPLYALPLDTRNVIIAAIGMCRDLLE